MIADFKKRFANYKQLADKTFAQLSDKQMLWQALSIPRNQFEQHNKKMREQVLEEQSAQNSSPVCFAKSGEVREDYR